MNSKNTDTEFNIEYFIIFFLATLLLIVVVDLNNIPEKIEHKQSQEEVEINKETRLLFNNMNSNLDKMLEDIKEIKEMLKEIDEKIKYKEKS